MRGLCVLSWVTDVGGSEIDRYPGRTLGVADWTPTIESRLAALAFLAVIASPSAFDQTRELMANRFAQRPWMGSLGRPMEKRFSATTELAIAQTHRSPWTMLMRGIALLS